MPCKSNAISVLDCHQLTIIMSCNKECQIYIGAIVGGFVLCSLCALSAFIRKRRSNTSVEQAEGFALQSLGQNNWRRDKEWCDIHPVQTMYLDYSNVVPHFEHESRLIKVSSARDSSETMRSDVTRQPMYTSIYTVPLCRNTKFHHFEVKVQEFNLTQFNYFVLGLVAKPYPTTSLPGLQRSSCGYHTGTNSVYSCREKVLETKKMPVIGDVVGMSISKKSGTVTWTLNGEKVHQLNVPEFRQLQIPIYVALGFVGECKLEHTAHFQQDSSADTDNHALRAESDLPTYVK